MSKLELIHDIKTEIKRVNRMIDARINRGLPYAKEARYHKMLVQRLSIMSRSRFLARSMRTVGALFS